MKIRLVQKLIKSNRANLVKVAVMVNGKHGQYSSHRWKNPTSAFNIMLEGLKKQGINTEQIEFIDKTTKEIKTQEDIIKEYK